MPENEEDKKPTKLAKAVWNIVDTSKDRNLTQAGSDVNQLMDLGSGNKGTVYTSTTDRMEVPTNYHDIVKICRFFYKHDPIAGTVINKMVDCSITNIVNNKSKCSDVEYEVFNSLSDMLGEFFRNACLEYLLSGLVIPHYEWVRKRGIELSPELNSRRRVEVPDNIWFRDPNTVEIKESPIPNKPYYYVKVSADLVHFIKNNGKWKGGKEDKEAYQTLVDNYPEFVNEIKKSKGESNVKVRLENIRPILSRVLPENPYPIPYMNNALESLIHKRNMKKMDYSIASRVIAAVQLVKLGSDDFPVTDSKEFDDIKSAMNYQTVKGDTERVFQLFANHTLSIEWVHPNTEAMLNREKYTSVEDDIIAAFGFPRALITGETSRSNVEGGSDLATFSPIATMGFIRDKFILWAKELYKEIAEKNNFDNIPIPDFTKMKLYDIEVLNDIGTQLYMEGSLSRTTRLETQGFDIDTEIERKKLEDKKYEEQGVSPAPPMPFSSPSIGEEVNNEESVRSDSDSKQS